MDETIKDIRATIFALHDHDDAAQPDLRAAIVALVEEMTPGLGFAPSLRLGAGLAAPVGGEVAEQALAALREALSNAARHARASHVDVTVDVAPDQDLAVQVADDGSGIAAGTRRSGLSNLASRAEELGGELRLSRPILRRPRREPGWSGGCLAVDGLQGWTRRLRAVGIRSVRLAGAGPSDGMQRGCRELTS